MERREPDEWCETPYQTSWFRSLSNSPYFSFAPIENPPFPELLFGVDSNASRRVLIVDDDVADTYFLHKTLRKMGIENVTTLSSGEDAAKYMAGLAPYVNLDLPHIIFLDLKMVGISGPELIIWLKKSPLYKHIPIIVFSGSDNPSEQAQVLALGAAQFHGKTATPDRLKVIIETALQAIG